MRITDVPDDLDAADQFFRYRARYLFDPATRVIQITRSLHAEFNRQVCTSEAFEASLPVLKQIERDTQAQIIVRAERPR